MLKLKMEELQATLRDQGQEDPVDLKFICPRCKTVQSGQDLIDAGAGADFEAVRGFVGFSCIGRFDSSRGCDWTLGGLFKIHELEVTDEDGVIFPLFRPVNLPAEEAEAES